jgi:hypothetical protein
MSAGGALAGPLRSLLLMTMAREHENILARAEAEMLAHSRAQAGHISSTGAGLVASGLGAWLALWLHG